eukprot:4802504-Prymnesium_polylepis.2
MGRDLGCSPRCTQCSRHWREVLQAQAGLQGRHWALECPTERLGTGQALECPPVQCQPKAGTGEHCARQCPQMGRHWGLECRSNEKPVQTTLSTLTTQHSQAAYPFHVPVGTWVRGTREATPCRPTRPSASPPRRLASAGRALELSGCETAAGINCYAPMATELPDRPNGQDLQAVCRRRIDVLID